MPDYQVALSFAGEQRDYVRDVAKHLQSRGIAVFYDEFETVNLWGKDGAEFFQQLFSSRANFVVMFISKEYVEKSWTKHERRAALSRAIVQEGEYVLPVRFDDTPVPGLNETTIRLKASDHTPAGLAALIAEKLGVAPFGGKASDVPPPQYTSLSGEVTFDYTAFNGRLGIGNGVNYFETMWSKSGEGSIHSYNDTASINGIAVARGVTRIEDIDDAACFDFTSRSRTPHVGEILVLRNTNGIYAAIEILDVLYERRNGDRNEARVRYEIQPNGTAAFNQDRA